MGPTRALQAGFGAWGQTGNSLKMSPDWPALKPGIGVTAQTYSRSARQSLQKVTGLCFFFFPSFWRFAWCTRHQWSGSDNEGRIDVVTELASTSQVSANTFHTTSGHNIPLILAPLSCTCGITFSFPMCSFHLHMHTFTFVDHQVSTHHEDSDRRARLAAFSAKRWLRTRGAVVTTSTTA